MSENLNDNDGVEDAENVDANDSVDSQVETDSPTTTTQKPEIENAPEVYEDFKVPENASLDVEVAAQFKEVAKELNLSQTNAQKLIDKLAPTIYQKNVAALEKAQQQLRNDWAEKSKVDTEFLTGEDSDSQKNFDKNLSIAKKAWETYGTPELVNLLNDTGLGNHPEVIRWAFRVGKTLQQDSKHVVGSTAGSGAKEARSLYPNSNHEV